MKSTDNTRAIVVWRKFYIRFLKPPKAERTICEVMRELGRHIMDTNNDPIALEKIREAHDMAKRMAKRLRWYRATFNSGTPHDDGTPYDSKQAKPAH